MNAFRKWVVPDEDDVHLNNIDVRMVTCHIKLSWFSSAGWSLVKSDNAVMSLENNGNSNSTFCAFLCKTKMWSFLILRFDDDANLQYKTLV